MFREIAKTEEVEEKAEEEKYCKYKLVCRCRRQGWTLVMGEGHSDDNNDDEDDNDDGDYDDDDGGGDDDNDDGDVCKGDSVGGGGFG